MENIINSTGLLHIAKSIITFLDYNDKNLPNVIRNLRLVCKSWRDFIDSEDLCKLWQKILLKKGLVINKDISNLIKFACDQASEMDDRKFNWNLSHFILLNFTNKTQEARWYLSNWPIYSKESPWKGVNRFEIDKVIGSTFKQTQLDMFLCNCPIKLLNEIPRTILEKATGIEKLLNMATFNFCREDLVKFLCLNFQTTAQKSTKKLIQHITWAYINCKDNHQAFKNTLENILKFLIDFDPETSSALITKPDSHDSNYKRANFDRLTNVPSNCTCVYPKHITLINGFLSTLENPLLFALHHDQHYNLSGIVNLYVDPLRKSDFSQDVNGTLELISLYAALKGYLEIAEIVAEKLGPKIYIDHVLDIMSKCSCWINEDVLKFMASKIDEDDKDKIGSLKDSSLHIAAKEKKFKFIINFAPFSTTIYQPDENGKNALILLMGLKENNLELQEAIDKLMSHGMKLDAKPDQKSFDLDHDLDDFDYESATFSEGESDLEEGEDSKQN